MSRSLALLCILLVLIAGCAGAADSPTPPPLSYDMETILPEDAIPALDHPRTVPVGEAGQYAGPQELVIGVEIDGEARAYPIGLMSRYEIANDTLGGEPILVTFCPVCNSGIVASREVAPEGGAARTVSFGFAGKLVDDALVMKDRETGSLWAQSRAIALEGPLAGTPLRLIVANQMSWQDWTATHPESTLVVEPGGVPPTAPVGLPSVPTGAGTPPVAGYVLGLASQGRATAFPLDNIEAAGVVNADPEGAEPVVIVPMGEPGLVTSWARELDGQMLTFTRDGEQLRDAESGSIWNPRTGLAESGPLAGAQLTPVSLWVTHWVGWKDLYPDSKVWTLPE